MGWEEEGQLTNVLIFGDFMKGYLRSFWLYCFWQVYSFLLTRFLYQCRWILHGRIDATKIRSLLRYNLTLSNIKNQTKNWSTKSSIGLFTYLQISCTVKFFKGCIFFSISLECTCHLFLFCVGFAKLWSNLYNIMSNASYYLSFAQWKCHLAWKTQIFWFAKVLLKATSNIATDPQKELVPDNLGTLLTKAI